MNQQHATINNAIHTSSIRYASILKQCNNMHPHTRDPPHHISTKICDFILLLRLFSNLNISYQDTPCPQHLGCTHWLSAYKGRLTSECITYNTEIRPNRETSFQQGLYFATEVAKSLAYPDNPYLSYFD